VFGETDGFAAALGAHFDFINDEDFVAGEGSHEGPEDGDGCAEDGDIDFEDGEDVDGGGVKGHVEYGYGSYATVGESDHAGKGEAAGSIVD